MALLGERTRHNGTKVILRTYCNQQHWLGS
jgi:hypothetical protein